MSGNTNSSGYIFMPYVMVHTLPIVVGSNFTPKISIKSRYSLTTVNSDYYMKFGWTFDKRFKQRESKLKRIFKDDL